MVIDVEKRIVGILERRLKVYLSGVDTNYREELTLGNFRGTYEQGVGYLNIRVRSLKSDLVVYELNISGGISSICIESMPYYRGNLCNSYFVTVFDDTEVGEDTLRQMVNNVVDSIRTDEQVEFISALMVGVEGKVNLKDYTRRLINYLNSNIDPAAEKLELKISKIDGKTGVISEFDYEHRCIDNAEQVIHLNFYKSECREPLGYLTIVQGYRSDYDNDKGKHVNIEVDLIHVRSRDCKVGSEVNVYGSDLGNEDLIGSDVDNEDLGRCIDNIRDIPGLEEGFINLIDSLGILK